MVVVSNSNAEAKVRQLLESMDKCVSDSKHEVGSFLDKGNKTAGTRGRKNLQELKKVCSEIRSLIQEIKNSGSVKKPKKKK